MEFMFSEDEDDTYYLTAHCPIMAALTFVTLRSPLTSIIDAFYVTPTQMEYGWVGAILKSDDDLLRPYRDPNNHWNRGIHIEGEELDERENDFFNPDGSRTRHASTAANAGKDGRGKTVSRIPKNSGSSGVKYHGRDKITAA